MSKPEGPVNIDLLAEKKAEPPDQGNNPGGWEGYDQRREALHRALRGGQ